MNLSQLDGKMLIKIIAGTLAVILILALVIAFDVPPRPGSDEVYKVEIPSGSSVLTISQILKNQGLIRSRTLFRVYVAMTGQDANLKAGTYALSPADSMQRIVYLMVQGLSDSDDITVTIPEGYNIWEVDERLAKAGLIIQGQFEQNYRSEEGHLFPDTYRFSREATIQEIVSKMKANYTAKTKNVSSQTLIIASMLEKEARTAEDMALVSGIIQKRMSRGMLLQIDATVAYGWCIKQARVLPRNCDVTHAPIGNEIKIDGPYNSYMRKGLPAGPISNPGLTALNAAANPRQSSYLYYLSPRDGSRIIYSKTAEEHAANRKKYLGL